jgi:S1-C subfamily serine protease
MDETEFTVRRREVLGALSAAVGGGIAGCSGDGGDGATTASTTTTTATPDRPNIQRQTILRDKAAITHIRRTVSGEVSWPASETYNLIDPALLGRWEIEGQAFEFYDDLTFRDIRSDSERQGSYFTASPENFLQIEYTSGRTFDYTYNVTTEGGSRVVEFYGSDGELIDTYTKTQDGEDTRSVVEYTRGVVVYAPDDADTVSEQLETGGAGSGFIVSPDGHIVTNAHVVGTHTDPEETVYFRLAVKTRDELRSAVREEFDISEEQQEQVTDILMDKLLEYYAENSELQSVSTDIGVLSGTAAPGESFEAKSWPATIETTGTVTEEVSGEQTWGRDIAVLKVDEQQPLPTVELGDATSVGTGEELFVVGYPDIGIEQLFEDRSATLEPTLTTGVVSARRTLNSGVETIQTDAGINSGNSGGPVYNSDGTVVGVATFKPTGLDLEAIGFALPINIAKGFMGELGVENEPGELTTTYVEGLEAYWRDDCETVTETMNAVLDMWPEHPYAEDRIDSC